MLLNIVTITIWEMVSPSNTPTNKMQIGLEELVKDVCMSETEGPKRQAGPVGRWKNRVKKYMSERGNGREGCLNKL